MIQQEQPQGHRRPERQRIAGLTRAQAAVMIGFVALVLAGLALFVIRAGQPRLAGIERADASNPALVTAGRQIYLARCAGCHGANGQGAAGWQQRGPDRPPLAPPVDARGPSPQRSDAWLFAIIQQGGQAVAEPGTTSGMPGFGTSLSDSEIWALISSIKSTWPAQLQTASPAKVTR